MPAFTGLDVHVYSVEDVIVDTNAETGTVVGVGGVTMDVVQAETADATPTPLRRAIEAQSFRPAIVRWSRSQPPRDDPLPWFVDTTPFPAATLAPAGSESGAHAIAFASTTPPPARFEGLTHAIARVNAIEGILAQMAQTQATTSTLRLRSFS